MYYVNFVYFECGLRVTLTIGIILGEYYYTPATFWKGYKFPVFRSKFTKLILVMSLVIKNSSM